MKPPHNGNVLVRIPFSAGTLSRIVLEELHKHPDLTVTLFSGRLVPQDTSFELEIEGPSSRIKEFLHWSRAKEHSMGASPSCLPPPRGSTYNDKSWRKKLRWSGALAPAPSPAAASF